MTSPKYSAPAAALLCTLTALTACVGRFPPATPGIAQPDTRPARAFTSFSEPLRCMDRLMTALPRRSYLISSSDIPDRTDDVDVGADDMLINAINQMNRSNGRYIFLDQARISGFGQLEIVTTRKEKEIHPQLYIRGSISQRDANAAEDETSANYGRESSSNNAITGGFFRGHRKLSVISVDLHLVQYPSRRVLPGASVANSMVVVQRGIKGTAVGIIDNAALTVPLTIERVESESQAVRNLVELGVIELLGRHSGVPYWTCLEHPATDAKAEEQAERKLIRGSPQDAVRQAQGMLIALGRLSGTPTGQLDPATRRAISTFQAEENILPSGTVDYDLIRRLKDRASGVPPSAATPAALPVPAPAPAARPAPVRQPASPAAPRKPASEPSGSPMPTCQQLGSCDDNYRNLYDLIQEQL